MSERHPSTNEYHLIASTEQTAGYQQNITLAITCKQLREKYRVLAKNTTLVIIYCSTEHNTEQQQKLTLVSRPDSDTYTQLGGGGEGAGGSGVVSKQRVPLPRPENNQ